MIRVPVQVKHVWQDRRAGVIFLPACLFSNLVVYSPKDQDSSILELAGETRT